MNTVVVVFAREPVPGRVKSRLAEAIGERSAARIYAALLEQTLEVAEASAFDVVVSLAEAPTRAWIDTHDERWEVQHGADLGARMGDAFQRRFGEGYDRVVIFGSDCPFLRRDHLSQAVEALERMGVVLGPACDGGYWLVAQRRAGVDLFTGIPWSNPATLAATRQRLKALGTPWFELQELDDVDTIEDLRNALADPDIDIGLRRKLEIALRS